MKCLEILQPFGFYERYDMVSADTLGFYNRRNAVMGFFVLLEILKNEICNGKILRFEILLLKRFKISDTRPMRFLSSVKDPFFDTGSLVL